MLFYYLKKAGFKKDLPFSPEGDIQDFTDIEITVQILSKLHLILSILPHFSWHRSSIGVQATTASCAIFPKLIERAPSKVSSGTGIGHSLCQEKKDSLAME